MTVWVAAQFKAETEHGIAWELQGVFDSEEKAVAACVDWNDSVTPLELNAVLPRETVFPPGAYHPASGTAPGSLPAVVSNQSRPGHLGRGAAGTGYDEL